MTTSPPTVSLPAVEICRLTVDGPAGRADLAVPVSTPVSELLPALLPHVAAGQNDNGTSWSLQRLGEDPLGPDGTPESLGLRHGDVLYLRPVDAPSLTLQFDDIADGVAGVVSDRGDRWRPELTRRLVLALACLVLGSVAATLLGAGPGAAAAVACGAVAVVLVTGSVLLKRAGADAGSVLVASGAACGFAALAGLTLPFGADGRYVFGAAALAAAACCAAVIAGALLALGTLPLLVPGTVLLTGAVTAAGAVLAWAGGLEPAEAAGVVASAVFVAGHIAPRLALRTARLRVPHLPHNAEELQEDIEPEAQERVIRGVNVASVCLDMLAVSSALVYTVAFWLLTHHPGSIGWLLPLVLGGAVLLNARQLTGARQRVPLVVAGALGPVMVLVVRTAGTGPVDRIIVAVVLLVAAVLLLVGVWKLPHSRLRPLWGQIGDILEMVTAVAVLPLLLQLLHVYAYFRALAG